MKIIIVSVLFMIQGVLSCAQDYQKYTDDFNIILDHVPTEIYEKEECDKMINHLDDLSDDIDKVLKDKDDLSPEDIKNLRSTLHNAEVVEAFLRAIGNSSYGPGPLKESQLSLAKNLLDFSITEMYNGKFCVNVYKISFGKYDNLVVSKKGGNDIFKIKAQIKFRNGNATSEIGLVSNQYRSIWSNADQQLTSSYSVINIICQKTGENTLGL